MVQAFLLITDNNADVLRKKTLFKLFDAGTHHFDVPGETIEVQSPSFVFRHGKSRGAPWPFGRVTFKLVDLTGDGILDVWLEHAQGVAVVSFQSREFVEVCSVYTSVKSDFAEYVDLDNDGTYEIKIPDRISLDGVPTGAYLPWMSLYEWDGTT